MDDLLDLFVEPCEVRLGSQRIRKRRIVASRCNVESGEDK